MMIIMCQTSAKLEINLGVDCFLSLFQRITLGQCYVEVSPQALLYESVFIGMSGKSFHDTNSSCKLSMSP